ncbi:MAG: phage integrase SAM-like domain-containing protein [Bacteroidaceae bacterium]|nr:phage integrase SAM-like domain-containing protein [Bacteroidaceae bacterium]
MLTINAEIKKNEQRSDKTYNVKLRFTLNRKIKRLSTTIFVTPKDLTKEFKIKPSSPFYKEVNELICDYHEKCAKLQIEQHGYTIDDVIDCLNGEQAQKQIIDFIQFCREWIASADIKGAANYTSAVNALVRFIGKEELDVKLITADFMERFKDFLNNERKKREKQLTKEGKRVPSNRTLSLYLMSIKKLFNEGKRIYNNKYKNTLLISHSPFDGFVIPKQESTRKRAISAENIRAIWLLPYKNIKKGYRGTCLFDLAKDCFILSFGLIGMNSADLFYATDFQDGIITYYRTKTKGRRSDKGKMQVKVPKFLLPLVDKYRDRTGLRIFNFYQYYTNEKALNKAINRGLKEIGSLLNVDDLEYYAARHSWATIAVNKVGIDKYTVHAALNHLDDSMKVTDIYIERDFIIENKANEKVLKYVFK